MKTLGVDLSYTCTGLALVTRKGRITTKAVKPPKARDAEWGVRVDHIMSELLQMASGCVVVLEGPAWSMHHGAFKLGMLTGVVMWELETEQIDYAIKTPSAIKKFATGKGNANKKQMLAAAQVYIPGLTDHNVADALFLAKFAQHEYSTTGSIEKGELM